MIVRIVRELFLFVLGGKGTVGVRYYCCVNLLSLRYSSINFIRANPTQFCSRWQRRRHIGLDWIRYVAALADYKWHLFSNISIVDCLMFLRRPNRKMNLDSQETLRRIGQNDATLTCLQLSDHFFGSANADKMADSSRQLRMIILNLAQLSGRIRIWKV